jgi:hypothetical protein
VSIHKQNGDECLDLSLTLANLCGARESLSCRVSRYGRELCYCLGLAVTGKKLRRPIFCAFNHRNPFNFLAKVELRTRRERQARLPVVIWTSRVIRRVANALHCVRRCRTQRRRSALRGTRWQGRRERSVNRTSVTSDTNPPMPDCTAKHAAPAGGPREEGPAAGLAINPISEMTITLDL